jgi:hypothetical protein
VGDLFAHDADEGGNMQSEFFAVAAENAMWYQNNQVAVHAAGAQASPRGRRKSCNAGQGVAGKGAPDASSIL